MNRAKQIVAAIVIVFHLWLFGQLYQHSTQHNKEFQTAWSQQRQAVADGKSTKIVMPGLLLDQTDLRELLPIASKLTELDLMGVQVDHRTISACTHLRILHLRSVVGDEQISALAQLRELEVLDLPLATGVTDAGLKALAGHPKLRLVRLRAPLVTDAGLIAFTQLPELRWLHLIEVPLTDAGLDVFRQLPKLESLYLDGDRATDDGLSALILARPDLHFHRDQVHLSTDPKSQDGHSD